MKPTKEIIELSKKLNVLGHKQEIQLGDYVYAPVWNDFTVVVGTDGKFGKEDVFKLLKGASLVRPSLIPIPSLEDGLEWLKERFKFRIEVWGHVRN